MAKFKIVCDYVVKKVAIVEAKDKQEARAKFHSGRWQRKEIIKSSTPSLISCEEIK